MKWSNGVGGAMIGARVRTVIDLNCDAGEGVGNEGEILPWVSSVSIACGGHAGDARTMAETMALARRHGVVVGAHPGFADRAGFGRREMVLGGEAIVELLAEQLAALGEHGEFSYVKPHGALYNMAARDEAVAEAVVRGVKAFDTGLVLVGLAGGVLCDVGRAAGLRMVAEGFADRRYDEDGRLVPRSEFGAVIEDENEAVVQGVGLAKAGRVGTLCVHGDSVGAVGFARRLREALDESGCEVRAFTAR